MKLYIILLLLLPIALISQQNVGIGIDAPNSRLQIHQEDISVPVSKIKLTNFAAGSSTLDGLDIGLEGLNSYLINRESSNLSIGTNNLQILNLLPNGKLGMNTTSLIGSSDFTLRSTNVSGFGGMYVDSPDNDAGKPFYGYGLNGDIGAYHFLDAVDGRMKFSFANLTIPTLSFNDQGRFYFNTTESISTENFTLKNTIGGFGGMLIESPDANTGKPMYAYAVDGEFRARHYYDEGDERFHIDFDTEGPGSFEMTEGGKFFLNGATAVGLEDFTLTSTNPSSFGGMSINSPNASNGRPFYGYAAGGVLKAFHYFDQSSSKWMLQVSLGEPITVDENGDMGIGDTNPNEKLVVNGRIKLASASTGTADNGTIYFNGNNFYGRINGVWHKMTDASANIAPIDNNDSKNAIIDSNQDEMKKLKIENKTLRNQMQKLENRLQNIESILSEK